MLKTVFKFIHQHASKPANEVLINWWDFTQDGQQTPHTWNLSTEERGGREVEMLSLVKRRGNQSCRAISEVMIWKRGSEIVLCYFKEHN